MALLCLAGPAPAASAPSPRAALEVGLRAGVLFAFGDDFRGLGPSASDRYPSFVPIELDLGVRLPTGLTLGGYVQYGAGLGKTCATGATCGASLVRLGADVSFHVSPGESIDPWLGLGFGYDIASFTSGPASGLQTTNTLRGFELLHLQGGFDVRVGPGVSAGPFLLFALGRYAVATASQGGFSSTADIRDQSLHEFVAVGLRGAFGWGL